MDYTLFAGLTRLDPGDPITIDGASFQATNPKIIDHLLQVGALSHRHDAHVGLPTPQHALTGSVAASGGQLQGNAEFAVTYTAVDQSGGETKAAPPLVLNTGAGVPNPTVAPVASVDHTQGTLPFGTYYYGLTYTDGMGGETLMGPTTVVYVDAGYASSAVDLSSLAAEILPNGLAAGWRLWRSYEGADWRLVTQGIANTYIDAGFNPPDDPSLPPGQNTTGGTNKLLVTIPTAQQEPALNSASAINIYLAPDTGFAEPCLYAQLPAAFAGATIPITLDDVSVGHPPHVSLSLAGAHQIYPDAELVFGVKAPVPTFSALPSGVMGDVRVTLDDRNVWAVLVPQTAGPGGWTNLTKTGVSGIDVMGSGQGGASWVTASSEIFTGSGQISHFANAGSAATMKVAAGLLTTTDSTQTDPLEPGDSALNGPESKALLSGQHWNSGVGSLTGYAFGPRTPAENQVDSWTAAGWPPGDSQNPPASPPQPNYTNPAWGANQVGDTLSVNVLDLNHCTKFWWDGATWQPLFVDAVSGQGYSANNNFVWVAPTLRRAAPAHETLYAYQWTQPGQLPDGYKMRARVHGVGHEFTKAETDYSHPLVGLSMNMQDTTHGLTYYVGAAGAGWTTRPKDLILDAGNWPPAQYADQGDLDTLVAPGNVQEHQPGWLLTPHEDFWVEVWRVGNTAYAAVYTDDPAVAGVTPVHTSSFDTTGTPYAAGQAGYFGVVFNHMGDQQVGIAQLSVFKSTVLPTVTLYGQQELVFIGSGGVSVAVQGLGSAIAEVIISGGGGGGVALAGSGGVGLTSPETYIEFVGGASAAVSVQDLGHGSGRVIINAVPGGSQGRAGIEVSGSAGVGPIYPVTGIEYAGSGGVGVAVQDLGGGSARVLVGASGAVGPQGPPGSLAVAGSAGAGQIYPVTEVDFAASGIGLGAVVQNRGGGSALVLLGVTAAVPKATQASGYTFVKADVGTVVESASAGAGSAAIGYILAPFSQSGIPLDSVIEVFQYGAGQVQIAPAAGVTLRSDGGKTKTAAQFATIGLRQRATDEWVLSGDLG